MWIQKDSIKNSIILENQRRKITKKFSAASNNRRLVRILEFLQNNSNTNRNAISGLDIYSDEDDYPDAENTESTVRP